MGSRVWVPKPVYWSLKPPGYGPEQIKDTTHNKSKRKILTHGQIRTLNQTIQNNRYQPRTPQGTMRYRQSPGPTKNKPTIN